ncbi:MAG: PAS domain S-box protein [Caldilinea sp. CFX5]|nr:PAS domain S-box protein [Caldilinea sp. CFX5]
MTTASDVNRPRRSQGRRTSAAQQSTWQFQANLLDQLSDAVIAVDLDERITYLNRAAVAQYRVDPAGVIGQPLRHIYRYEWLQPEDEAAATTALAQQGHWRGENRHICQDGSSFHVEALVTVLRDEAGNAIGLLATSRDITDRKQMERDLRASELRYRRLADTLPQLVWTASATGVVDYYNIHIHDFDPAVWHGAFGFEWESLLHPDDRAPTLAAWQQAVQHRRPYSCEHRLQMADGSWRWHLSRAVLVQDPDSGLRWYGTATDIHERKVAEEALRASEERYRTLFETMDEGFCVFELLYDDGGQPIDYRFLEVNPAFARFTGLENAVGKTAYELVPTLEPHWVAIYGEVARTGEARHFIEGSAAMGRYFEVYAFRFGGPESRRVALLFTDITERKLTEDALRDSEEDLRYTIELNPQVPWTADPDGNIISFNQRWLDLTGLTEEQALGGGWAQAPHPDDHPAMVAAWTHSIQSGEPYDIEHRIRLASGDYRWMRSRAFPRRDKNGAIVRWYGATEDIHEHKVAEDALRRATARFERAERAAHGFVFESDLVTRHVTRSPNFTQITGYAQEEVPPTPDGWLALIHPDDLPLNDGRTDLLPSRATHYTGEYRLRHQAGHYIWVREQGIIERDECGRPLAIVGTTLDITASKEAEAALRASEARLRQLADAMPQIVWQADAAGRNIYFNQRWLEYTGLTLDESFAGASRAIHPAEQAEAVRQWQEVRPLGQRYEFELRLRRADGCYRWHLARCVPVYNTEGQLLCWYGTSTDIHDRKEAELALQQSEANFRTLANTVPSIIWTAAPDGTITYANAQWLEYCGLMPEENARQWPQLVLHPDDFERCVTRWLAALASGEAYSIEVRNRRYDGVYRWFLTRATPLPDADGQITAWFGVTTDIDERKQAELNQQFLLDLDSHTRLLDDVTAILALAAERLGQYLGVAHCTFSEIDLATDQVTVAAHWRRTPDRPTLLGPHPLSTYVGTAIAEALTAGHSVAVTDVAADPRTIPLLTLYQTVGVQSLIRAPFKLKGAQLAVLSVGDAEPRRWRPDEVRLLETVIARIWPLVVKARTEQALHSSEERLRLATEAGGVGIFDHDLITNQTEISPIYAQITGLPLVAPMPREAWLALLHPDDRTMVEAIWQHAQATGASYYYECRLLRPDGALVWIEVNAWVTTNDAGQGIRITGAIRDITERKQAALHQQFLLNLNSSLRTLTDAGAIQQTVVDRLGQYLAVDRCRFNAIDLAADSATLLAAWSRPGLPPPSDITPLSAHASAAYIAGAQAGRTLVVQDAGQDEQHETARALLLARGFAATIVVPCLREGQWVASLHVLQRAPRQWRADEVQLVENVVHHFWPLVEKARTEEALRASEARFRAVQQATPDGFMIFESVRAEQGAIIDFRWRYVNPASEQMVGRTAAELLGKCLLAEMPGNRDEGLFDAYVQVVETGEVYQCEFCYQHDGIDRWFRNTAAKVGDGFAVTFSDITARKRAAADQQLLTELAEQIRMAEDADELVAATVRLLGDHLQVGRCLWIEVYSAQQRGFIRAQHCRGLPPVPESYAQADYSPVTRGELAAGRVLVNYDAQQDLRTAARYETVYAPYQERAYVGVPFLRAGIWRGILSVTTPEPRSWQAREIGLLETVAERVWLAVDKLRLVAELRANEARYRTIFEHAGVSLWEEDFSRVKSALDELTAAWRAAGVTDPAAAMRDHCAAHPDFVQAMLDRVRIVDVNEETARLYGRSKAELLRPFAQHFDAETRARFVDQLALLAVGGQRYHFDGPITTPQGETRHIAFTVVFPTDGDFTRVLLSGLDVTPLKAAELENRRLLLATQSLLAQVQEGERFLQSIADTIPNVIYLFDLCTMRNRYANRQLAVTLGYTPAEAQALGDQFIPALIHPDDERYLADHLTHLDALADGEMADWEYRMQHKGGEWRWLNSREIVFARDEQGRPTVILGALQDITARKEAEMALRASEARFRHLAEAMPQLVWACQADGSLTYINQQWHVYSGIAPAVTVAEGMWSAMHPADEALNREQWRQALTSGAAYEGEVRLRRHDGCYRWFLERAIPVRDEAGVIQQWFGVSMDVHDRKEAEETIRRQLAEIEAIYATAPVGLAVLDAGLCYVRVNEQLAQLNGIPAADHIGRTGHAIIPEVMATVEPLLRQVIATGQPLVNREIVGSIRGEPGVERLWLESFYPLCDEAGVVIGINTMVQEITERKRQERHQQFLSELGLDLRLLSDSETILTQLVSRLGEYLQVAGCRVNEVDCQRAQFTPLKDWIAADAPWPAVATSAVYPLTELAPPALLTALQAGQTVVVANTLRDPRTAPVADNYENDQVRSLIGVPIFRQGEWRATLSVKGHGERHWRPDEVTLLETVAGQLSALLEKVRAEEALRQSEERLRLALAGGGMGIWESQIATNHSLWSPEEYALFGLPPDRTITNELFNRLVHPDDLPGLQAAISNLVGSGRDHIGEFRIIRPDGAVRWLADRVTVIRDEAGQPVRLLGINFDITERKEREAMIQQQLAEIEAIYATAPVGLCLLDRDLRYVRINETLATINGSTIAGQLGRTLAETQPVAGYRILEPLYRGVIETGMPLLNQEVHESYVDPAQARDWLASYYPLKNADGVVIGVNAVILEITERKRYERQLKELNASLEERVRERTKALEQANRALSLANRELEQFTYAAAHDLRSPLRGIANLVQWISEDAAPVLSPDSQRHLATLGGRVTRLEKMLEDLLAYSRVGRVHYRSELVDVQQLVHSSLELLAPPVGFVVKAATPLPTFDTLHVPLALVFRNLLSNAIRHHHQPAQGQVVITVRDLGEWYEFCVSDDGPGIDPRYHERIFGMFQTLKPRDQVEGSGIGLALVKKTVESVGGRIWMESALGQGTRFYFTWPKG